VWACDAGPSSPKWMKFPEIREMNSVEDSARISRIKNRELSAETSLQSTQKATTLTPHSYRLPILGGQKKLSDDFLRVAFVPNRIDI
jgi:hypothetical protein